LAEAGAVEFDTALVQMARIPSEGLKLKDAVGKGGRDGGRASLSRESRGGGLPTRRPASGGRETLASFAQAIHLDEYLLLGKGEEESGGRSRPATLCNAFEAFIGALYLDQGYEVTARFLTPLIQQATQQLLTRALSKDVRSQLQELTQARFQITPRYKTIAEFGPDHAKQFVVEAYVGPVCAGRGQGHSKQAAAKQAAAQALEHLQDVHRLEDLTPLPPWDAVSGKEG